MSSNNFINRDFKIRFILLFCLIVFISAAISGAILYVVTYQDIGAVYLQSKSILRDSKALLVPAVFITIIFQTIIITVIVAALTLFASHKIVGPLYRLGDGLKKAYNRDLTCSIRFRATDPIGQIADIFNYMTGSLCQRIGKLEQRLLRLKDIEKQLDDAIAGNNIGKDKLEVVKNSLECEIAEIKKVLAEFKTT